MGNFACHNHAICAQTSQPPLLESLFETSLSAVKDRKLVIFYHPSLKFVEDFLAHI